MLPVDCAVSSGNSSISQPDALQVSCPRRTIFTDEASGNLTGKSFSLSCAEAERRESSPSTNSARSGRGEPSKTRLKRADALGAIDPRVTVRDRTRLAAASFSAESGAGPSLPSRSRESASTLPRLPPLDRTSDALFLSGLAFQGLVPGDWRQFPIGSKATPSSGTAWPQGFRRAETLPTRFATRPAQPGASPKMRRGQVDHSCRSRIVLQCRTAPGGRHSRFGRDQSRGRARPQIYLLRNLPRLSRSAP